MCQGECPSLCSATPAVWHATIAAMQCGGMGTAHKPCHACCHLFHHLHTEKHRPWLLSGKQETLQDLSKGQEQHLSPSALSKRCPSFPWILSQILPNSSFVWLSWARCKPQVPLLPLIPTALFLSAHFSLKLSFSSPSRYRVLAWWCTGTSACFPIPSDAPYGNVKTQPLLIPWSGHLRSCLILTRSHPGYRMKPSLWSDNRVDLWAEYKVK